MHGGNFTLQTGILCYDISHTEREVLFVKKILVSTMCLMLLTGCAANTKSAATASATAASSATPSATADPNALKINNTVTLTTKTLDMSGYTWLNDNNPAFLQVTMEESLRLMDEGGTGMVVYSYSTCPWCNRAIPVLNAAAKEMGIKVYYVDVYEKELMDSTGKAFSTAGKAVIRSMLSHYDSILKHETNSETGQMEPALYTPEVVAIKNGQIVGHHTALVDSFSMSSEKDQMNDAQKAELTGIYEDLMKAMAD